MAKASCNKLLIDTATFAHNQFAYIEEHSSAHDYCVLMKIVSGITALEVQ